MSNMNCYDCAQCKKRREETGRPHPADLFRDHIDLLQLAHYMQSWYPELTEP